MKGREIKFRAWDKKNKAMIPIVAVMPLGGVLIPDGESKVGDMGAYQKHYKYKDAVEVEAMQYTGLKDKHGKEIFEGDILKLGNRIEHVACNSGAFVTKDMDEKVEDDTGACMWTNRKRTAECEIIGNIYENPELLGRSVA